MDKRARIIFVVFSTILLSGCSQTAGLFSNNDPDGDFDTKGATYFPMTRPASSQRVFVFDPKVNAWAVYNRKGERVNTGRASGGKFYCPDIGRPCKTVVGQFRILDKGDASCASVKYPRSSNGGASMPYCMHFHPKGYAIHGVNGHVPDYYNSHGCIGVTVEAAKWLNNYLNIGSSVIVTPYPSQQA